jgi:DNA repair protein RadD
MYQLREYQEECVAKMEWAMDLEGNDIVSVGQGGGKSIIIAEFVNRIKKPILVLCPNKELLEQNIRKMSTYIDKKDIGIYSASLNEKTIKKITFGTIQSVYKNSKDFAKFDIAIVDECDLVNPKKLDTMFRKFFLKANVKKVFGLTATPFRLGTFYKRWGYHKWQVTAITVTQMINRHYNGFWHRMLYVKNVKELQDERYLVPLTYHDVSVVKHKELKTNKTKSEFDLNSFEKVIGNQYPDIAKFIKKLPHKKKLVFCSSVEQAEKMQSMLPLSVVVTAKTSRKDRQGRVVAFREEKVNILLGVGIFTVGFDVPDIDCIVSLKPTRSLRLWTQVIGRGTRLSKGKDTCHIYDLVGNVKSLGTLENMEIRKINDKWNVVTEAIPMGFHNVPLFEFDLNKN